MKKLLLILLVGIACTVFSASVRAATPDQIEAAIDKGVAWIATQQQADGSWFFGGGINDVSTTGLILVKLCDRAYELDLDPFDNSPASPTYFPYADNVIKGFDFLLAKANFDTVGISSYGYVYSTGISMMGIAASNVPDRIVSAGPLSGQTYKQVLQGMMDWMVDAQNDSGCEIGGWGYWANQSGWSDNSNSGYATIGIGFAGTPAYEFKIPVPDSVRNGLDAFIANIQLTSGPYNGGSIYLGPCSSPYPWANILKTGNLLYEMALAGFPENDPRVLSAVGFIENYWNAIAGPWDGGGWIGDYQAMFLMKKGFAAYDPPNDPAPAFKIITVGGNPIDWFDVVSTYIVNNQQPNGSWIATAGETSFPTIDTAWALLTLEPTVPPPPLALFGVPFDIKPGSCPNPINVKSKGVLPAAIMGTDNLDVTTIDPASLRLRLKGTEDEGVAPLSWTFADVGAPFEPFIGKEDCYEDCVDCSCADGFLDLVFHFDTQEVVAYLDEVNDEDCLVLEIIGALKEDSGGTPIIGEDVVRMLVKDKKK